MNNRIIDETGNEYGYLTVLEIDYDNPRAGHEIYWKCQCKCGNITSVSGSQLRSGMTRSCGCLKREMEIQSRKNPEIYMNDEKGYGIAFLVKEKDKNCFVAFDSEDVDVIKSGAWSKTHDGYIRAYERGSGTNSKAILLHRTILSKYEDIDNKDVDHANHNLSDERKNNIRSCTRQENNVNRRSPKYDDPNHHMHVCYNKSEKKWQVGFKIDGKNYIKKFKTRDEAIEYEEEFSNNNQLFSNYGYNENEDIRNKENCRDFSIGGENDKLHPFYIVDGESMAPPNPEDIITPFIITPFILTDPDILNKNP